MFVNLKQIISLIHPSPDLSVQTSLKLMHYQFSKFSGANVLGVGHDLSPHYRQNLEQFRRWHPETKLGDPGPSQVSRECKQDEVILGSVRDKC